jgi:hypothetical protein
MEKMILFLGIALFVLCGCKEKAPVTVGEGSIVVDITQPEKNLKDPIRPITVPPQTRRMRCRTTAWGKYSHVAGCDGLFYPTLRYHRGQSVDHLQR